MTDEAHADGRLKPTLYSAATLLLGTLAIGAVVAVSLSGHGDIFGRAPDAPAVRGADDGARIQLQPYALPPREESASGDRLTSPARRHYAVGGGRPDGPWRRRAAGAEAAAEEPPGRLPSGEFVAAVTDHSKVFLPNPSGNCNLVASTGTPMTQALDDCFAGKAAR